MKTTYNENDPKAAAWLRELVARGELPAGDVDERSIEELGDDDVGDTFHAFAGIGGWPYALACAGWPTGESVWTGSCPCQPFSAIGRRRGAGDARHLWPVWFRLIEQRRPSIVFGEQVASRDGRNWFGAVRADLETLGYGVGAADLCAAGVGSPHVRQRIFWGAARLGDTFGARLEGHAGDGAEGAKPGRHDAQAFGSGRAAGGGLDWLAFDAGVRRPVQSGLEPMADGLPARVVRCSGYGNAIQVDVAVTFIRAFRGAVECARP